MKKRLSALCATLVLVALVALLASCGGTDTESTTTSDDQTATTTSAESTESADQEPAADQDPADEPGDTSDEEPQNAVGETYDVGDFTVYVPAGWVAIPQNSLDEPGTISTSDIEVHKEAEYDEASGKWVKPQNGEPYILITYFAADRLDLVSGSPGFYDNTEDLPDMHIGNFTWQGFEYELLSRKSAMIWAIADDCGYNVVISYFDDISLDDPDVQAILESLT